MSTLSSSRLAMLALVLAAAAVLMPAHPAHAADQGFPLDGRFPQEVTKTTFSNTYGARRTGGRRHRGTDLMAAGKMTEVYALADGVVTKVASSTRPGRYVMIEHAEGWESYYIHLNNDNLKSDDGDAPWYLTLAPGLDVGSEVTAGQLIAWAGDSGNAESSSPHTHFELLHDGHNVNPYPVLLRLYEQDAADLMRKTQILQNQISGEVLIS